MKTKAITLITKTPMKTTITIGLILTEIIQTIPAKKIITQNLTIVIVIAIVEVTINITTITLTIIIVKITIEIKVKAMALVIIAIVVVVVTVHTAIINRIMTNLIIMDRLHIQQQVATVTPNKCHL
jgi:hypothetical protein